MTQNTRMAQKPKAHRVPCGTWESTEADARVRRLPSFRRGRGRLFHVTRYALHVTFYISHVNKGIKFVEFKGKKGIIRQIVAKCRFLR